ncbi:MAG: response regulator [Deltaproteobacteria bacterium]|nr:response regulator [Deltaproteobacteria bacterium]
MADQPTLSDELRRFHYLVAEQNTALLGMMTKALKDAGAYKITTQENGAETWQAWKKDKNFQVVICSNLLPEMGGIDILTRIRSDKDIKFQPAFLLTSQDNTPQAANQALDAMADVFLGKPFSAGQFLEKVQEAVEVRKQISGADSFKIALESSRSFETRMPVALIHDRNASRGECEEVSSQKCVVRSNLNYGLGTTLVLQFPKPDGTGLYQPTKGTVMKTERVPGEIGMYRVHIHFQQPLREHQGSGLGGGLSSPQPS